MSSSFLVCALLSSLFSYVYSLNCYSYVCLNLNSSVGPSPPCSPPQAVTCVGVGGAPMAPDRCITQRFVSKISGITIHQEIRNCSYSVQCNMRDAICNAANVTGYLKKCELGCCQGDLCNSGGPIPTQAPGPTGPSGADLTCLACSSIPTVEVQTDCKNPIRQTCGAGISPFIPQDRCMTFKATANVPFIGLQEFKTKNCSNAAMCNQNFLCSGMNSSGTIKSCHVSCCFGNVCNADSIPTTAAAREATTENSSMSPSKPATTVYSKTTVSMATGKTTGADLTCLACSSIPTVGVQTDCKNPIRQTCGAGVSPFIPQDRCMTVKATANVPFIGLQEYKAKNCSNAAMCNQNLCSSVNSSGMVKSCQVSCCFGNVCNADSIQTTAPTATEGTTKNSSMSPSKSATTMATGVIIGLACFLVLITVA